MKKLVCLATLLGGSLLPMVPPAVAQVVVHKPGQTLVFRNRRAARRTSGVVAGTVTAPGVVAIGSIGNRMQIRIALVQGARRSFSPPGSKNGYSANQWLRTTMADRASYDRRSESDVRTGNPDWDLPLRWRDR
jgi:hypothetical protein